MGLAAPAHAKLPSVSQGDCLQGKPSLAECCWPGKGPDNANAKGAVGGARPGGLGSWLQAEGKGSWLQPGQGKPTVPRGRCGLPLFFLQFLFGHHLLVLVPPQLPRAVFKGECLSSCREGVGKSWCRGLGAGPLPQVQSPLSLCYLKPFQPKGPLSMRDRGPHARPCVGAGTCPASERVGHSQHLLAPPALTVLLPRLPMKPTTTQGLESGYMDHGEPAAEKLAPAP